MQRLHSKGQMAAVAGGSSSLTWDRTAIGPSWPLENKSISHRFPLQLTCMQWPWWMLWWQESQAEAKAPICPCWRLLLGEKGLERMATGSLAQLAKGCEHFLLRCLPLRTEDWKSCSTQIFESGYHAELTKEEKMMKYSVKKNGMLKYVVNLKGKGNSKEKITKWRTPTGKGKEKQIKQKNIYAI